MGYHFADMPDKTKDGVMRELSSGLVKMVVYYQTVHGLPIDMMKDLLTKDFPTNDRKLGFYMDFRNRHPKVFQ